MTLTIDFAHLKFLFIDFDGTLVDSVPFLYEHYSNFLKKYEREGSLEEFKSLMGPAIPEFVPLLKARHKIEEDLPKLIHVYTEELADRYKEEAQLIKGSQLFLDYAKTLGLKMVLVTSSAYSLIEGSLEKLKLHQYFEHFVTGEKVQKTKPNPEIYLHALKVCSATPKQVLAIEDSYNGILSSMRADIPTIAIFNDHSLNVPEGAMLVKNWEDLLMQFKNAANKFNSSTSNHEK